MKLFTEKLVYFVTKRVLCVVYARFVQNHFRVSF